MKKVVFKWVTTMIDYTSEAEAKKDIAKMKGVYIKSQGWTSNCTFSDIGQSERCYTVEIQSPYSNKYPTGY